MLDKMKYQRRSPALQNSNKKLLWIIMLLGIIGYICQPTEAAVPYERQNLHGYFLRDKYNIWQHGIRAGYVLCEGYIGSPLIPDEPDIINSYLRNCEPTPPPSAMSIIDVPENHSTHYEGYPAYPVKSFVSQETYFVCDGFLSSTGWCSEIAHRKKEKMLRALDQRFTEQVSPRRRGPAIIREEPDTRLSNEIQHNIKGKFFVPTGPDSENFGLFAPMNDKTERKWY